MKTYRALVTQTVVEVVTVHFTEADLIEAGVDPADEGEINQFACELAADSENWTFEEVSQRYVIDLSGS